MTSYCRSLVTMALSGINSEIKRDIGRKTRFFHTPPAFDVQLAGVPRWNIAITFGTEKLEWCGY